MKPCHPNLIPDDKISSLSPAPLTKQGHIQLLLICRHLDWHLGNNLIGIDEASRILAIDSLTAFSYTRVTFFDLKIDRPGLRVLLPQSHWHAAFACKVC